MLEREIGNQLPRALVEDVLDFLESDDYHY